MFSLVCGFYNGEIVVENQGLYFSSVEDDGGPGEVTDGLGIDSEVVFLFTRHRVVHIFFELWF